MGMTPDLRRNRNYHGGIVTNAQFVGGMLDRMIELGETRMTVTEGGGPAGGMRAYAENGYVDMVGEEIEREGRKRSRESCGVRLAWTTRPRFRDYREDELTWAPVKDGAVHRVLPIVTPALRPGTVLMNVPTFKTHNLGVMTLCCKGLQGVVAQGFKHFCSPLGDFDDLTKHPWGMTEDHLVPDFREKIRESYRRHVAMGLPMWDSNRDKKWDVGRFELWSQRIADVVSILKPYEKHCLVNVVEGIIGRDGTAFNQGKDRPAGLVVAGVNPVHVDAVACFLAGHDPRYVPFLVVAAERGLGRNDIRDIEVYEMGSERRMDVEELGRMVAPLPVYLHGDGSKDVFFNERYFRENAIPYAA
jgi:hypothetical protein